VPCRMTPTRPDITYVNVSAIYLSANHAQHHQAKLTELDIYLFGKRSPLVLFKFYMYLLTSQFADIFTKGLPTTLFREFQSSLHVAPCPSSDCGSMLENANTQQICLTYFIGHPFLAIRFPILLGSSRIC
jgi:hypothetical protein